MTISNRPQSNENCVCIGSDSMSENRMPLSIERLAVLGHEIRNPLSALSYALQSWPSSNDEPEVTAKLLQIMRRQVSQLTSLCNDLLDAGRCAQGTLPVCRASVDLRRVIRNACEEIQPFVDQCGHKMTVSLGKNCVTLLGDESKLTQVFSNLMHNATKFTDRNGHLHISIERIQDTAVIRLSDNGRGICPERLRSIFAWESGTKKCSYSAGEGLGIGLRLAKSIVELHEGTIEAFSVGLGCGSTFEVRLPIIARCASTDAKPGLLPDATEQIRDSSLPRFRIVVLDDDRSVRFLMPRLLVNLGHSVSVADRGDKALNTILQDKPQVVFIDLKMHGMDGYQVAKQVRSRRDLDAVFIVALSGNADVKSRALAIDAGFDHYLTKPTSLCELSLTLAQVGLQSSPSSNLKMRVGSG
jgi:CheY-like chemotaxis protein/two-component sensor histidine kinase